MPWAIARLNECAARRVDDDWGSSPLKTIDGVQSHAENRLLNRRKRHGIARARSEELVMVPLCFVHEAEPLSDDPRRRAPRVGSCDGVAVLVDHRDRVVFFDSAGEPGRLSQTLQRQPCRRLAGCGRKLLRHRLRGSGA